MMSAGNEAFYWSSRAEREEQLARRSHSRGEASFHRNLAQRFLDMAHSAARAGREQSA